MKAFALALAFLLSTLAGCGAPGQAPDAVVSVVTLREEGLAVCSGVAIKPQVVLTAFHCLDPATRVDGQPVVILAQDGHDHALIRVAEKHPVARMHPGISEGGTPKAGLEIELWGHPIGLQDLMYRKGHVAGDTHDPGGTAWTMYDLNVAPGDSGSPVFHKGRVVGTVSILLERGGFVLMGSQPYAFTAEQWELE